MGMVKRSTVINLIVAHLGLRSVLEKKYFDRVDTLLALAFKSDAELNQIAALCGEYVVIDPSE